MALGDSRVDGDGSRLSLELLARSSIFFDCAPGLSPAFSCGTKFEELRIVDSIGLVDCSLISNVEDSVGRTSGMGMCSVLSAELILELETARGGGFRLLLPVVSEEPDDSNEGLRLLPSCCWPLRGVKLWGLSRGLDLDSEFNYGNGRASLAGIVSPL